MPALHILGMVILRRGSRGGEMGEFSPPLYLSPLLSFLFSYPLNIEIIFDFPDVITKIHPPFQNPGSALEYNRKLFSDCPVAVLATSVRERNVTDVT